MNHTLEKTFVFRRNYAVMRLIDFWSHRYVSALTHNVQIHVCQIHQYYLCSVLFFSVFRNLLYSCTLFIPWCPQMMMVCVLLSHGTRKLPFMWKVRVLIKYTNFLQSRTSKTPQKKLGNTERKIVMGWTPSCWTSNFEHCLTHH